MRITENYDSKLSKTINAEFLEKFSQVGGDRDDFSLGTKRKPMAGQITAQPGTQPATENEVLKLIKTFNSKRIGGE